MTQEQTAGALRQAEVEPAQGRTVGEVRHGLRGIGDQLLSLADGYGGLRVNPTRRMKKLKRENARLKLAVAELTLDEQILKEATEGKYQAPSVAGPVPVMCEVRSTSPNARHAAALVSRILRSAVRAASGTMRLR
ncbi:hypothetical protein JMJ56_19510 [Belnapia sp. T18]|uniref:Transposase n=1 Tax=Belnapia arida TaxID=2804533 RepID=A0ABS1U695_9PROT|nr:hypothetical protein [Belnapia arida]MBL6080209.1 hypothetical protein [Belnapia arida]